LSANAPPPTGQPEGAAGESLPATMARAAAVTDPAAPSRAQASCDDPSGAFLAPQCQLGRSGKSHMTRAARAARAASSRRAALPIGGADASLEAPPPRPAAAASPAPAAETAAAAAATDAA